MSAAADRKMRMAGPQTAGPGPRINTKGEHPTIAPTIVPGGCKPSATQRSMHSQDEHSQNLDRPKSEYQGFESHQASPFTNLSSLPRLNSSPVLSTGSVGC